MARPMKENLSGKRYGRLLVLGRSGSKGGQPLWSCICDCGANCLIAGAHLRLGNTKSCGCWKREAPVILKTTHGHSAKDPKRRSRLYTLWNGMRQRCHNPNQPHYARYGGRGIRVCDEWRNSFEAFYRDMGEPPKDGQRWTLDRIDVDGNYEPGNVRWATYGQQADNKRPKFSMEEITAAFREHISTPEGKAALEKLWPTGTWFKVK